MSAIFSPCRTWRYTLTRMLADDESAPFGTAMFIGLNPSTADEVQDDPTVRRMIGFATRWGYRRLIVCNAFAYRATDPKKLRGLSRIAAIGPENNRYLIQESRRADLVVAAWGAGGSLLDRSQEIVRMMNAEQVRLHALGFTEPKFPKRPEPRHPLYMRADVKPTPMPGQPLWFAS